MISLDYQDDENIEKHPHLNWVVVLVDLNSKSTIDMLIILITFDMIKIVIVNLVKLLLKMLKMIFFLPSASGEVVWLWKMAKTVVLRRIFIFFLMSRPL